MDANHVIEPDPLKCDLCMMQLNGLDQYLVHLRSRRHNNNLNKQRVKGSKTREEAHAVPGRTWNAPVLDPIAE